MMKTAKKSSSNLALVPSDTLVEVKGAGLNRGGRWLVREIDLSIKRGEIVTLIGPNGSGKSTTAKMALGTLEPDEGTSFRAPNLTVGYVPQSLNIDWTVPLRVERFMRLTAPLSAVRIEKALDRVGIAHLAKAEVRTLSGGEFQRALLARAIAREPELLVLDEPVQGVDHSGQVALYRLISEIRDELNCGVLLISHDLHVVMAASDTVVCLNGHICCQGAPSSVVQNPDYLRLFGTHAADAIAIYEHRHDHTHGLDSGIPDPDHEHCDHDHQSLGPGHA
ncbi:MAG: metal ABC transporter ATP-binding protein [Alphaproteobacteria bacterium]